MKKNLFPRFWSVLLDIQYLSCKYFPRDRKQCRGVHSSNTCIPAKSDVCGILTINLLFVPRAFSLFLVSSLAFSLFHRLPAAPESSFLLKANAVLSDSRTGRGTKARKVRDWTMNAGRRNDERESWKK